MRPVTAFRRCSGTGSARVPSMSSVSRPAAGEDRYWGLWLRLWPDGEKRLLAHAGFHGQWLEWLA